MNNRVTNEEKAPEISELFGIGEETVLRVLDESYVPMIEKATSIEEIHEIRVRVSSTNAVVQRRAIEKWNALSAIEVEKAKTIEEVSTALGRTHHDDEKARKLAKEKWDRLSMMELENAKTAEEARIVYNNSRNQSETKEAILEVWTRLSLDEILAAKTLNDLSAAFEDSPKIYPEIQTKAILRAAELIS